MKTGCLVKGLIISTIFFAGIFYIITNKKDELIINPIKKYALNSVFDNVEKKFSKVNPSRERDSLFSSFQIFMNDVKKLDNIHINKIENVATLLDSILIDKKVDSLETQQFILITKKFLENERSEKNRN